ncbi:Txe/YoeB family addiction module toxin [Desulfoplanes sp. PS50]
MAKDNVSSLIWTLEAWDDYQYWQTQDKKTLKRVNRLIKDCLRHPFEGIGKSEPLRENLGGFWSRRIDETNRLVYCVHDEELAIISCRYHYDSRR